MWEIKSSIAKEIKIVGKVPVKYFLSLEVNRVGDKCELSISKKSQIKRLLKEHNMTICRSIATPLDPKHQVKCNLENVYRY